MMSASSDQKRSARRDRLRWSYRDGQDLAEGVRGAYRITQEPYGWKPRWILEFRARGEADWVQIGDGWNPGAVKYQARQWDTNAGDAHEQVTYAPRA